MAIRIWKRRMGDRLSPKWRSDLLSKLDERPVNVPRPVSDRTLKWLERVRGKKRVGALQKAVFDFDRRVRNYAVNALAKYIGWKKTVDFINARFKNPGKVPAAFFYNEFIVGGSEEFRKWRQRDWQSVREQALIDARKMGLARMYKHFRPFSVNGVPVFLCPLGRILILGQPVGFNIEGLLVVEKDTKELCRRDREAIAWHEFGETFSHQAGNAFMLDYLKRTRRLEEFMERMERYPALAADLRNIEENWQQNFSLKKPHSIALCL